MREIEVRGRAKINLTLDVLGKRPDGFHEVEMIMQSIELHDLIEIREISHGLKLTTDHPLLREGSVNIAHKAAGIFMEACGIDKGVQIHLQKKIPVAAGLAGGSTDAASVLVGLNKLWEVGLTDQELMALGAKLGSDVPFCILGGSALATGRGEKITRLPDSPEMWLVLVKPPIEVSTAEVYGHFDSRQVAQRPDTAKMMRALRQRETGEIRKSLVNVLESVTLKRFPIVSEIKEIMANQGIDYPLMSGSGPTVFGFTETRLAAEETMNRLQERLPGMFVQVSRTWPAQRQDFPART